KRPHPAGQSGARPGFRLRVEPCVKPRACSAAACAAPIPLPLAPCLFRCGLRRGRAPSETRLSRRSGLVETAARGEYGGLLEAALVVAVLRLVREKAQGSDELV